VVTKWEDITIVYAGFRNIAVNSDHGALRRIWGMIEINDAMLSHYAQRIERARRAAAEATSETVRELHLRIAQMYERELDAIRSKH
jgi:hypothetical protein